MGKQKKLHRFYLIRNLKTGKCEYVGNYKSVKSIEEMTSEEVATVIDVKASNIIENLEKKNIKYDIECNQSGYSDDILIQAQLDILLDRISTKEWRRNLNDEFRECFKYIG